MGRGARPDLALEATLHAAQELREIVLEGAPALGAAVLLAPKAFAAAWEGTQEKLPRNAGRNRKARHLDCAVINWWLDRLAEQGTAYQTVRCAFSEGAPIFSGMEIMRDSHVQIAVRDPARILGVFRPYAPGGAEQG